ncbi:hypothetical protein [uncultured Sphingomonas sp.]|uniref:hypothetical protein n=1 Tax=uncultured Sphingomonas sp. TaxID=158754 RepID=UPI0035CAE83F
MRPLGLRFIAPVLLLSASGCAINALRLEGTNRVTLTANAVVTQANAALDSIKIHRQDALFTLIASDPNCPPVDEIYVFVPSGPPIRGAPLPPLCASDKDQQLVGYRTKLLHFTSVSGDRLKPTVLMIGAVAEYAAALKAIADRPKTDVSAVLASAAQKAADAKALTDAVLPDVLPAIPNLETKQAKTATALAQFFVDLADEASRAKDVGSVYRKRAADIDAILDSLKEEIVDWNSATTRAYAEIETSSLRRADINERNGLGFEARRAFLKLIQQAEFEQASIKKVADSFEEAVDALAAANGGLGKLLRGDLSPEQRTQESRINEERIFKALKLTVDAATAWGVI